MEILFEVLAWIVSFLAQLVWELLMQIGAQVFGEALFRGINTFFETLQETSAILAALGHAVAGLLCALVSLYFFPVNFIVHPVAQVANLVIAPLLCGAAMALIGAWFDRHGRGRIRFERFGYGAAFAFVFAMTRFIGTRL